ncbi:MAG: transglutaminase domain-containing protein [Candidatus Hydrogenedentes bacterium]|nr:transglutaminase domain-containing protein [Candidatus Hydrogenedentota bacterium]
MYQSHKTLTLLAVLLCPLALAEQTQHLMTELSAIALYDNGEVWDLMRGPDAQSVVLSDWVVLENDAPGAGLSEKGPHVEPLHQGVLARKTFQLADVRAKEAHVVLYMKPRDPKAPAPYYLRVNGRRIEGNPVPWHEGVWHWVQIPDDALVPGVNQIEVGCDAPAGKGFDLLFAREDEYERGGGAFTFRGNTAAVTAGLVGTPYPGGDFAAIAVGETSAKSADGGATWTQGLLGPDDSVRGEYCIRLNLVRHVPRGTLITAPIDLWQGLEGYHAVLPQCRVANLRLHGTGATPSGADLEWGVRYANTSDVRSAAWDNFDIVATGPALDVSLDPGKMRYVQVRVRLTTTDTLATPALTALRIERDVSFNRPAEGVYVQAVDNPTLRYSTFWKKFEDLGHPQLKALRERLKLDEVVAGAVGDFEKINRVRHHVSQLWYHRLPYPEYPEWSALTVLDRSEKYGWGGMCMQFVVVFTQALQSLGYQARHVNLFNHESVEVWVDDLDQWVLVDPESVFDSYEYDMETGAPLSALEQHDYFLKRYAFSAAKPIPWMSPGPWCNWPDPAVPETSQPLEISTFTDWINDPDPLKRPPQHNLAGFVRFIPRNDFVSHPAPRPLNNGSTYWPWSGFVCWYDGATPRRRERALNSDRIADFYPTLNRVHFEAVYTEEPGVIDLRFVTQPSRATGFEVNIDGTGWTPLPAEHYRWTLRPAALNRLEVRTKNSLGVSGKPSALALFWHYRPAFVPKPEGD